MAEKTTGADPHYEETTAPQNPPNSMLTPRARTGWLVSSFGTLVAVFLVVASVFVWVIARRDSGPDTRRSAEPQAIGTSGVQTPAKDSPGRLENAPIGARVTLTNVTVDRVEGGTFWVRDGDVTAAVVVPGGVPTVREGQRVNISGTVEATGATTRIRASRIGVR